MLSLMISEHDKSLFPIYNNWKKNWRKKISNHCLPKGGVNTSLFTLKYFFPVRYR